ncbi:Ada metal-binding domain-containing protein [Fulvivirga lutimaris]|uniref:Ada metal-binding domain-containing protein n=1 Tax=Fulvivirga lutimaris TaxID=1819566 RepID=UPI0012BC8D2D|nr:Ada metal-binding domain-containing protein [Fulvivirga lutimaris]MTI39443.1 metal-binding protein [Fulvivirga lutimaris]
MIHHETINDADLHYKIRSRAILYAGNRKLKIYGQLSCRSGKRMNKENRVFFKDRNEALSSGYRPCGHCLNAEYKNWKNGII